MIIVIYNENTKEFEVLPNRLNGNKYIWQYDYGQTLRIQGLHLPSAAAIHFSLQETGGTSVSRVGVTKDGVTDVIIPDSMLENDGADRTYDIFAFIYLTDDTSGQTEYKIKLQIKSRPKPEVPGGGENPNIFHEAVQAVQKSADKAAESEKQAEGWTHGREDLPERAQDNAKYYAGQAAADAKKTEADHKEVERLVESVSGIDEQVVKVENLTKQAQTSATNAALSEQAAKTAEANAQNAQAGAETAEGNAELAERNAKASEQAVEKAKQLVTQMGQEVLDNKNHVDQTAQAFTLTAQQAVADVNNAGQTQTERVEGTGNTAVESVKTAQGKATQAVETAKTEAVKAVQTEGATQTGNVSAEGEKQVQAVQQAAQEIAADREQIAQNKTGIEALKQGKADAIVETASGEDIQIEDSSGLGFEGLRIFGKSMQDGVPSPESPVPIVNVGDKGTVEVEITGKNLLNLQCYSAETMYNLEEEPVLTNNYGTEISTTEAVNKVVIKQKKIANTEIPFSYENGFMIFAFRDDFVIGKLYNLSFDLEVINNPLNANEIMLLVNGSYSQRANIQKRVKTQFQYQKQELRQFIELRCSGMDFVLSNIMITEADCDYKYEPYHDSQFLTLATPNGLPGVKVDSDGNYTDKDGQQWVCDEIDLARGKYVQRIEKVILDGSQKFSTEINANANRRRFGCIVQKRSRSIKTVLSTHFRTMEYGYNKPTGNNTISFDSAKNTIMISTDKFASVEEFKNWLNENNVIVVYALETPIEHDLTPEEIAAYKALHTNYPTTVISNDESVHMEVSYVADTKNYIASKIETPLQKQITDLQNALISQKISGGGIKVTDSAKVPIVNFSMWGKTEQVKTTGAQLFDKTTITPHSYISNDNGFIREDLSENHPNYVLNSSDYILIPEATKKIFISKVLNSSCIAFYNDKKQYIQGITGYSGKNIAVDVPEHARYARLTIHSTNLNTFMVTSGDTEKPYEPYSGGFPSPSPDWEQPIEVTGQPVTVTVKGGTDQQSVTLVPPRPLTKWDKLEKVDGVWRWMYQSRWIESYVDENITGEYISTTGGLNAGAKVCYKSTPEYIPLPQPVQDKLNVLTMYAGTTEITNDGGCNMELTYTVDTQSYVDKKIAEISKAIL